MTSARAAIWTARSARAPRDRGPYAANACSPLAQCITGATNTTRATSRRTAVSHKPGLHDGIPEQIYHGDKTSLSSSGIRDLLKKGGPARFAYRLEHGAPPKVEYDEGHAAHSEVLGTGLEVVEVAEEDWKKKAAQEARAKAYADGKVPLLTHQVQMVRDMGEAVRACPRAVELLSGGRPEVTGYAVDPATWVMLRSRMDYMREHQPGRLLVRDYKTTLDAAPEAFESSSGKYLYAVQEATYRRVAAALGYEVDEFVFIAQEKTPPYLLSFHEVDEDDLMLADELVTRGIEIYAECRATGVWPGYDLDITNRMRLSRWQRSKAEELLA